MGSLKRRIIEAMEPKEEPPMQDIVHELRLLEVRTDVCYHGDEVRLFNSAMRDAANEIERLRTQGNGLAEKVDGLLRERQELYRNAAAKSWIPVTAYVPEIGVSVLCSGNEPPGEDRVWIGQREQYEWYFPGANEMGDPTHWMPLPAPPTDAK